MAWLAGCGASDNPSAAPNPSAPALTREVYGMVLLDRPREDVPLEVQTLDGQVLYQTRSHGSWFRIPQGSAPDERFRVVARLPDGDVQCLGGPEVRFLAVNAINHLVALTAGARPLAEAEADVRRGLAIPAGTALNGLSNLRGSPFSHQVFLDVAARNGGFNAYSAALARRLEGGEIVPFVVGTPARAEAIRALDAGSAGASILSWVGNTAGSDLFNFGLNDLLGAVTGALGLNVGNSANLSQIEGQLDALSDQLNTAAAQIQSTVLAANATSSYLAIYNSVTTDPDAVKVQEACLAIANAASAANVSNATSTSFTHGPPVPNPVTSLVNQLQGVPAAVAAQEVANYFSQGPNDNPVMLYSQINAYTLGDAFGAQSSEPGLFNYALRRDLWTVGPNPSPSPFPSPLTSPSPSGAVVFGGAQANLDLFTGYLLQALYLIAETGQLSCLPGAVGVNPGYNAPGVVLNDTRGQVLEGLRALTGAQNLVPAPTNCEWVYLDIPNGLMWCTVLQPNPGDIDPSSVAANFQLGPWTGWRVPTYVELDTLRGQVSPQNNQGLIRLGFTGPQIGDVNEMVCTALPSGEQYDEYAFSTGAEGFSDPSKSENWSFLMVRSFPNLSTGDNADLIVRSYGFLPDSLTIGAVSADRNVAYGAFAEVAGQQVNVSDRVTWTSSAPDKVQLAPVAAGVQRILYVSSQQGAGGFPPPSGSISCQLRGYQPGGGLQSLTASVGFEFNFLTMDYARLSPAGAALPGPPKAGEALQFYVTGWWNPFPGNASPSPPSFDTAQDLTRTGQVKFEVLNGNGQRLDPEVAQFNPNFGGSLVFGPKAASLSNTSVIVTATATVDGKSYNAGNATVSW